MKKIFCFIFSLVIVLSSLLCLSSAENLPNAEAESEINSVSLLKNQLSADIYGIVCEKNKIDLSNPQSMPDSYAGAYIDENDQLHICVTAGYEEQYKGIVDSVSESTLISPYLSAGFSNRMSATQNSAKEIKDKVVIQEADYSYKYLLSISEILYPVMEEYDILEMSIDEIANKLRIKITDIDNQTAIQTFLSVSLSNYNQDAVTIVEGEDNLREMSSYAYNGDGIARYTTQNDGSIGFNATFVDYQNITHYGIVTNAHVAPDGFPMLYNGELLGDTILNVQGASVDLAFIEFSPYSEWKLTNILKGSSMQRINAIASSSDMVVGRRVVKYGDATGIQYGTITSTNFTATINGIKYNNLFQTSYYVQGGDSGGTVVVNSIGSTIHKLLGITSAGSNDGTNMTGVKYSGIQTFGITAYIG